MKVLFFLESMYRGGKERRALELMHYLKSNPGFEILLVLTEAEVYYQSVHDLGIKIEVIKRRMIKHDPGLFFRFYRCCKHFKPDIIHAWGKMTTFYAIPAKLLCKVPLLSNLISDTKKDFSSYSFNHLFLLADICFSDIILSNSHSGLAAYQVKSPKAKVIPNGVRLERFDKDFDKERTRKELGVKTEYLVVMVASFSKNKDYDLFLDIARDFLKIRNDTTFIGVGDGIEWNRIQQRIKDENLLNVILTGMRTDVEPIIAASDIGILCTYSEGISNSIIEYMALGKPVISTDITGGSRELIINGSTGYCVERSSASVVDFINLLLENSELRFSMGERGRERIYSQFSIERMGGEYYALYNRVLSDGYRK